MRGSPDALRMVQAVTRRRCGALQQKWPPGASV